MSGVRTGQVDAAVLRGMRLDPRPVKVGPASAIAGAGVEAQGPAPKGYDDGFRAGCAEGEAVERERQQAAAEASARAGFERGREEGRAQGIAEGREAGRLQTERDARADREAIAARTAQLDRITAAFAEEFSRRLEAAEEDLVALCHAAVCRILGDELPTRNGAAQLVRRAVRQVIGELGAGAGSIAVHVHPQELAALESDAPLASWIREQLGAGVRWVADDGVRLGGCLVRSAEGTLDARLETQLEALGVLLRERRQATSRAGGEEAGA